ncbi:leukotoxin LktA family filamentous adhesin [Celeribacter sp. ULVN23_4]
MSKTHAQPRKPVTASLLTEAKRDRSLIHRLGGWLGTVSVAAMQVLPAYADVVAVGNTGTSVSSPTGTVDVTTSNVKGDTAFNQFSEFNVGVGDQVNLYQPLEAQKLVNIITGGSSQIDGMVTGYLGVPGVGAANQGNLYFVNSDGFVVSATGSISAGQITMTTPTADFVSDLTSEANGDTVLSLETPTSQLFLGTEPLSATGVIDIQGSLYAQRLDLRAGARMIVDGRLEVDTDLSTGKIDPAVNIDGVPTAGGVNIDSNGVIRLYSAGEMDLGGTISAKGDLAGVNPHGGLIEAVSDGDMTVGATFDVSNGAGDAGSVMLYTKGSATMEPAFEIQASSTSGSGGFFALRAVGDITDAQGTFDTSSDSGDAGESYLIGENVTTGGDIATQGGSLGVSGAETITVSAGNSVSTNPDTADVAAGDLILTAPTITVESGASLTASAAGDDLGGLLALIARNTNTGIVWAINPESESAEITITEASLEAGSIIVSAVASASNVYSSEDEAVEATQIEAMENAYDDAQFDELVSTIADTALLALEGGVSTLNGLIPLQVQVLTADAKVTITDSEITANGNWAGRNSSEQNQDLEYAENGWLSVNGLREDTYRFMTANSYFDVLLGDDNAYQMKLYLPSVWDDTTDSLLIHSHAETVTNISPLAYGAGLAVAVTNTSSRVGITGSTLLTEAGNIRMASTAMENMTINIAAKKIANGAAAVAVSVRDLTNQIVVDGGSITSAGSLDMGAFTGRNISQTLVANSGTEGRLAIAVNVDVSTSLTEAALGGTIETNGDVAVDAETLFFGSNHVTTATMGVANAAKVVATRRASTTSLTGLATTIQGGVSTPDPNRAPHFGLGVAVDVQLSDDNTFATIGGSYHDFDDLSADPIALGTTTVTAMGYNVAVNAAYRYASRGSEGGTGLSRSTSAAFGKLTYAVQKMLERYNATHDPDITEDELLGRYSDALMMNVSVSSMLGETQAEIGSNATINAGSLDLSAVTRFPNTSPLEQFIEQWDTYADAVTSYQPIGETGQAEAPEPELPPVPDLAGFIELANPLTYLTTDSKAKGEASVADDRVVVPGEEQGLAIGLTVTYFSTENTTKAVVRDGATVNLDTDANITALQEALFLHVVNLPKKNPLSGDAKVNDAIGAGIFVSRTVSDVRAEIESGATFDIGGALDVDATTNNIIASLAYSGGQGSDVAVNATIDAHIANATTVARIGEAASITADTVSLTAKDTSFNWLTAGAVSGSENVGVGASGVFNLTTRDIWAGIGTKDGVESVDDLAAATGTVITANSLSILAENSAVDVTVGVAGTKVVGKPEPETGQDAPQNTEDDDMIIPSWLFADDEEDAVNAQQNVTTPADQQGTQQQSGWAVSGAAVVSLSLGNSTRAEILTLNKIDLTGGLDLTARNTATTVNVGGAVSAGMGSTQDTNALAGAFAVYVDTRELKSRILGAEIVAGDSVVVTADDGATVANIAVGGAGTSRGDLALAGSVAVAVIDGETEAEISDATITSDSLTLDADDSSTTVSVGGAVGINMDATQGYGVGVGIAVNTVSRSATSRLSGASVIETGALSVTADSTQSIYAFATTVGVGKTGLAGSISVNTITGGAQALVQGSEDLKIEIKADSATVDATETNTIFSLGGALAGGRSTAVGAALTVNVITATTESRLEDVNLGERDALVQLGAVAVTSDSTSTITSIAVAGGAATEGSAAGVGLSVNEITAKINTSLARSTVTDAESIDATATNTRSISSLGGGLGISGRGAAGVAATVNLLLGNTTSVDLTDATLSTRDSGAIFAKALADGAILSMAAGLAGSTETAIGGAVTVNVTTADTSVIADRAVLDADGALSLIADDTATVQSLAGGAALSVSGNAVGGAVSANFIAHDTSVTSDAGSFSGDGVTLQAVNGSTIESMAVGLAGGAANAFSGSIAIGDIGNTTKATLTNATLDAGDGIALIDAGRTGSIDILSGAAAVGGENAAGIALTVASIHGGVTADLTTGESVTASELHVTARNTANIDALAVSGALGGSSGGAGSVVYTQIGRVADDGPSVEPIAGDDPNEDVLQDAQDTVAAERDQAITDLATSLGGNTNTSLSSDDMALNLTTDDVVRARLQLTGTDPVLPDSVTVTTTETTETRSLAGAAGIGLGGAGVGAGIAVNLMFGKAEAELVLPAGEDTTVGGDVTIGVTQTGTVETAGVAGAGGSSVGAAGSITVNVMNRQADARIISDTAGSMANLISDAGDVSVGVTQGGTIKSLSGSVAIGGTAGAGGAITVNVMSDDAEALVEDVNVASVASGADAADPLLNGGDISITADQTLQLEALSASVGGGGSGAFAGSFAINVADGEVFATLRDAELSGNSVEIAATATLTLIGNAGTAAGAGTAAVGLGIVTNVTRQTVRADIDGSDIYAYGTVGLLARADATMSGNAVSGSGAGGVGVTGTAVANSAENTVEALVRQTRATGLFINENDEVNSTGDGEPLVGGSYIATRGTVAIEAIGTNTITLLGGTDETDAVEENAGEPGISVNFAGGGAAGVGASVTVNTLANDVRSAVSGNSVLIGLGETGATVDGVEKYGVAISALGNSDISMVAANGAAGGAAGVAALFAMNLLDDTARVEIGDAAGGTLVQINSDNFYTDDLSHRIGSKTASSDQDTEFTAKTQNSAIAVTANIAVGGSAGVGVGSGNTLATNLAEVSVGDAIVEAANDVNMSATAVTELDTVTMGLAGGFVGVSANAGVNRIGSEALVTLDGADVTAGGDINLNSKVESESWALTGSIGGGAIGGSGGVQVTLFDSKSKVTIGGGTSNRTGSLTAGGSLTAEALSELTTDGNAVSGAGGGTGIALAASISLVDAETAVEIGAGQSLKASRDLTLRAKEVATIKSLTGSAGAGGLGVGASLDYVNFQGTTKVQIGNGAVLEAYAGTTPLSTPQSAAYGLTIEAFSERDVEASVFSTGAGVLSVAAALSIIELGGSAEDDEDKRGTLLAEAQKELDADQSGESGDAEDDKSAASSLIAYAGASETQNTITSERQAINLTGAPGEDVVSVDIGRDVTLKSRGFVDLTAETLTAVKQIAGGASISGTAGAMSGTAVTNVATGATVYVGGGSRILADGTVSLTANSGAISGRDLIDTEAVTVAASTGVSAGAGVAVAKLSSQSTIAMENDTSIKGYLRSAAYDLSLSATRSGTVKTDSFNVSVGAGGGVGVAVSHAMNEGASRILLGSEDSGDLVTFKANTVTIAADDTSHVDASGEGSSGGIGAGLNSVIITADVDGTGEITARNLNIDANSITMSNESAASGMSEARGLALGAVAIGAAVARTNMRVALTTDVDAAMDATSITLNTRIYRDTYDHAKAIAASTSGGLLAGNGAVAEAYANYDVSAAYSGTYSTGSGTLTIATDAEAVTTRAETTGRSGGAVAIGVTIARSGQNTSSSLSEEERLARVATSLNDAVIEVGTFNLSTGNAPKAYATADAGSGGVVSGSGAETMVTVNTDTSTVVGDTAHVTITATDLNISAGQSATLGSTVDTLSASIVGASGANSQTDVDTDVTTRIGGYTTLAARNFNIEATNTVSRPEDEFNIQSGSGGALDVPAMVSLVNVDATTNVYIDDDLRDAAHSVASDGSVIRSLTQTGERDAGQTFYIGAYTNMAIVDRIKLDAGGAIAIPIGNSTVKVNTNDAHVSIGAVEILTQDTATFYAGGDANLKSEVDATSYGLAGAATGNSYALYNSDNRVIFGDGADVESLTDVRAQAGYSKREAQSVTVNAETRVFNKTAVPIPTDPAADAIANTTSIVESGTGSSVKAVTDVYLLAEAGGRDVLGYGRGKDLYREVLASIGSAISQVFGGKPVSLDIESGTSTDMSDDGIIVNGYVRAGSRNQQILILDSEGNLANESGGWTDEDGITYSYTNDMAEGIDYSIESGTIGNEYDARIALLQSWIDDPALGDDVEAVAAWEAEISLLQARMASSGGSLGSTVDFVVLDDIVAAAGDIILRADYVIGDDTGTLEAPGNTQIIVRVYGENTFLKTADMTIPDNVGGRITFNDAPVTTPAGIEALASNQPAGESADFEMISGTDDGQPLIEAVTYGGGSVIVNGNISNAEGTARFRANTPTTDGTALGGDLDVRGDIYAKTIDLSADRDFVQGYSIGFTEIDGSPGAIYDDYFSDVEDLFRKLILAGFEIDGSDGEMVMLALTASISVPIGLIEAFEIAPRRGQIQAGRNVYITADKLNINGLIQAGTGEYTVDIGAELDAELDKLLDAGLTETVLLYDPSEPVNDLVVRYDNIESDVRLTFVPVTDDAGNVVSGKIVIDPMVVQGGYVDLRGDIFSTGGGEIKSLDGFGTITVDSLSDYAIELGRVDLGEYNDGAGIEGIVRITDTSRTVGSGDDERYLITEFSRLGDQFTVMDNDTATAVEEVLYTDEDGNPLAYREVASNLVSSATGRSGTYETTADRDLVIKRAETVTQVVSYRETTNYFWVKTGDSKGSKVTESSATQLSEEVAPGLTGTYLGSSLSGDDYAYYFSGDRVTNSVVKSAVNTDDKRTFGIGDVVKTWTETQTATQVYTHRLKADYGVKITFEGDDTGGLTILNGGDITFTGPVINAVGDTTITSSNGSVLTSDPSVLLSLRDLSVSALGGRIGGLSSSFRVDQEDGGVLNAVARDSIDIRELTGDMIVDQITTTDRSVSTGNGVNGEVTLSAEGGIYAQDSGSLVTGTSIDLLAYDGGVGTEAQALRILEDGASLVVLANEDVFIEETEGDLNLHTVESQAGSVSLTALDGAILDRNDVEQRDMRTLNELTELWADDLGLYGDAALQDRKDAQIEAQATERKRLYETYWQARNADGGATQSYTIDADVAQALLDSGWTQDQLDAYVADRVALYDSWNAEAAYDASYTYELTVQEISDLTDNAGWTEEELNQWVRAGLIRGTGDTNVRVEDPNVIAAGDITLIARDGVGELMPDYVLGNPDNDPDWTIADDLEVLATAERADVTIDNVTNTVTVARAEDVNFAFTSVNAEGQANGSLRVTSSGEEIYLAAETPAAIANISTTGDVRLKIDGAVTDNRDGSAAVTGSAIIVESGNDASIGEADNPLTFDVLSGGNLIVRAGQDLFIHGVTNLPLGEAYAGGTAVITSTGTITDAVATGAVRVRAADLTLEGSAIGSDAAPLVLDITGEDGMLDLTTTSGDAFVTVASDLTLEAANIAGGGRIEATSTFDLAGSDTISFGLTSTLDLIAPQGFDLSASAGTDVSGGTLILTSGGNNGTSEKRLVTALTNISLITTGSDPTPLFIDELDAIRIDSVVQSHEDADTNVIAGGAISIGQIETLGEAILTGSEIQDGRIVAERVALTATGTVAGSGIGDVSRIDITTGSFLAQTENGDVVVLLRDRATDIEKITTGGTGLVDLIATDAPLHLLAGDGITTQGGSITIDGTSIWTEADIASQGGAISIDAISLLAEADITSEGGTISIETSDDLIQKAGSRIAAGTGTLFADVGGDMQIAQLSTLNATSDALRLTVDGSLSIAEGQTATQLIANSAGAVTTLRLGTVTPVGPDGLATQVAILDAEVTEGAIHIAEADGITLRSVSSDNGVIDIFAGGDTEIGALTSLSGDEIVVSALGGMFSDGAVLSGGDVRLFAFGGPIAGVSGDMFYGETSGGVTLHLFGEGDVRYTETAGDLRIGFALSDQGDLELAAPVGEMELGVLGASGEVWLSARDTLQVTMIGGALVDLADESALQLVNPEYYGQREARSPELMDLTAVGDDSHLYAGLLSGKGTIGLHADNIDAFLNDNRVSDAMLLTIDDDEGDMAEIVDVQSIGDGEPLFVEDYFADVRPRLAGRDSTDGELILVKGRIGTGQVTHAGPSFIGQDVIIGGDVWFRQRSFDFLANLNFVELSTEADAQALAINDGAMTFQIRDEIDLVTIDPADDLDGSGGSVLILNRRLGGVDLNGGQGFAFGTGVDTDILGYPFTFRGSEPGVTQVEVLRQIREQSETAGRVTLPSFITEEEGEDLCIASYSSAPCLELSMLR